MNVLVTCEFSGVVREAFRKKGHNAWSLDLLPALDKSPYHFQADLERLERRHYSILWDLMIAHPPCTYLCSSGLHWNKRVEGRQDQTEESIKFVKWLSEFHIEKIAIENPIGCLSSRWRKPDQIIQPWQFGHPESKATCLWLKGLPPLQPTNILIKPESGRWNNQTPTGQNKLGPSKDRWALRSITYQGIADAMADQWG